MFTLHLRGQHNKLIRVNLLTSEQFVSFSRSFCVYIDFMVPRFFLLLQKISGSIRITLKLCKSSKGISVLSSKYTVRASRVSSDVS